MATIPSPLRHHCSRCSRESVFACVACGAVFCHACADSHLERVHEFTDAVRAQMAREHERQLRDPDGWAT